MSVPGQVRVEMYTKILDCLLSRSCFTVDEGERELEGSAFGIKERAFDPDQLKDICFGTF